MNERKLSTIYDLAGSGLVTVINKSKATYEVIPETMSILELLHHHMSGLVDYQILGWNSVSKVYEYYDIYEMYLTDKESEVILLQQSQSLKSITIGKHTKTKVVCSRQAMRPIRKIKPTDELLIYTGDEKELEVTMPNWVQMEISNESTYEISLWDGKTIVVNGLVLGYAS